MAKKMCIVHVTAKDGRTFGFDTLVDTRYLDEWREAGIEIYILENSIPEWVADLGLVRIWCFLQDVWNLRNPWRS